MKLTFEELRQANHQRTEETFHPIEDWSPTDWATCVSGEVGEACNLIKKLRRGWKIDSREIGLELADAVIYIDLLADRLGLNLDEMIVLAFNSKSQEVGSNVKIQLEWQEAGE